MVRLINAPEWIVTGLANDPPPPAHPAARPSTNGVSLREINGHGPFDPFDWLREQAEWPDTLNRHDWQIHSWQGNEVYYTRPDKAIRDGKSAVLHEGGPLVVFTTEVPRTLERVGRPTVDGTGFSVSIVEFICAYEFDGDMALLARTITERHGPPVEAGTPARATAFAPAGGELYPPRDFYDQRPWMAACRQMAEAVGGSPAAHLLAYLARWATLIPPGFSIPPINGAASSFDLLCVIAGTSGSGKTSPMRNAEEMLPVQRKDLIMGLGIGSGEGIIEAFYGTELVEGDDGKKRKERRKTITGINFAVSEGMIFADLAQRGGTTHVTRLCDAWSGAALSTANASAETFRHIPVNQYRITLMMGIQATQAHELMTESAASQGFVGRLLFAWAEEPRVAPRPDVPEPFIVPPPIGPPPVAGIHQPVYLTYPADAVAEIQAASDQRVGTDVPVEDHHHDLLRCKVAGILALMDERTSVSDADWSISTTLVEASAVVRRHLYALRRQIDRDRRHTQAEARGESDFIAQTASERRAITDYKAKIVARLRLGPAPYGTDGGLGKMTSSKRRWMVEFAVNELVAEGAIVKVGDRYELAP